MDPTILSKSNVAEWFAGRNILITGSTGFLGKVLLEKLLRCCPQVQTIYVLLRNKHGNDHKRRLEDLINTRIFDGIRDHDPNQLTKVVPIAGDVTAPDLGISQIDLEVLRKNVTIVFHCAANVRFDQKLRNAISFNTGGTYRTLKFTETLKFVDVFIHVSTAYCHCELDRLEEITYEAPHPPESVIEMCNWMPNDLLEVVKPRLIGNQPNTYAYSKRLSESLVANYADKFPIAILRPSIVTAAWKEPIPGWIENLNGPTGLLVGAGKGVIRSMHCNKTYLADVLPVDIAVNAVIATAYNIGRTRPKQLFVANITASEDNPLTWGQCLDSGRKHVYNNPFSIMLWYPDGSIKQNKLYHTICVFLFHLIPAYLIDGLLILLRKKPFMIRVQERIQNGLEVLQYYTTKEWRFTNNNFRSLPKLLNRTDQQLYYMDIKQLNWDDYIFKYVYGAREFCLNESPDTLPRARVLLKRLYYLDRCKNLLLLIFGFWCLYNFVMSFVNIK